MVLEGTVAIASELRGNVIKFHHIACDMVVLLHIEMVELVLSKSMRIHPVVNVKHVKPFLNPREGQR